jgi:expansin
MEQYPSRLGKTRLVFAKSLYTCFVFERGVSMKQRGLASWISRAGAFSFAHSLFICSLLQLLLLCLGCRSGNAGADSDPNDDSDPQGGTLTLEDPLYAESTVTVAEWITEEWYTCETEESACGLPCESNDMWVAINETDFRNSRTCSACMEVSAAGISIIVEVIENCGGACIEGEIELSRTAFDVLGNLDDGRLDVSWKLVPCDRPGPISIAYEVDSDEWWAGIQVRNPALPVDYLEIRYAEDWERLEMDGWNHFPVSGDLGTGPFDLRITAIDGQQIVEEAVPYVPGETVSGTKQFDISSL